MPKLLRIREIAESHDFTLETLASAANVAIDLLTPYWNDQIPEDDLSSQVMAPIATALDVNFDDLYAPQMMSDKFVCPDDGIVWL